MRRAPLMFFLSLLVCLLAVVPIAGAAETTPTVVELTPESSAALASAIASDLAPVVAQAAQGSLPATVAVSSLPTAPLSADLVGVSGDVAVAVLGACVLLAFGVGLYVVKRVSRG